MTYLCKIEGKPVDGLKNGWVIEQRAQVVELVLQFGNTVTPVTGNTLMTDTTHQMKREKKIMCT